MLSLIIKLIVIVLIALVALKVFNLLFLPAKVIKWVVIIALALAFLVFADVYLGIF